MESKAGMIVRVLKRLRAAVGYHELGMTQHALRCLDSLTQLGKIGPFGLVAEVLRGEFVKHSENVSAAKALETIACMLPTPARHAIEMTLATCYGHPLLWRALEYAVWINFAGCRQSRSIRQPLYRSRWSNHAQIIRSGYTKVF
ncbi:MAG: hypothetical protein ACLP9L_18375 [Thermoguttaceae bacterium]